MRETRVPGARCLYCGTQLDAASSMFGDHKPSPGDATICLYCGHIMVFRKRGRKRVLDNPNREEARRIAGDPRILRLQQARAQVMMKGKAN
jgi:hypothetical protein